MPMPWHAWKPHPALQAGPAAACSSARDLPCQAGRQAVWLGAGVPLHTQAWSSLPSSGTARLSVINNFGLK